MSEQKPAQAQGGDEGRGSAAAPQAEGGGADRAARHGRRRSRRPPPQQSHPQRRPESALNMEELRELTDLFSSHGLTDFEFENADIRIRLSRNPAPQAGAVPVVIPQPALTPSAAMGAAPPAPATTTGTEAASAGGPAPSETAPAAEPVAPPAEEDLNIITSPIVGTFYRAPSPNADPFVRVGSSVEPDTVVCIIEAMKLMNEIQAETTGTVEKIYVENGQPVEYGQPLFGVKK